jgi:DNA-binding LacI/PurR family transcriptional regulator
MLSLTVKSTGIGIMSTIRDVARASGVSTATVSYVLNNKSGEVSADTRERVMRAIRELDYRSAPQFMRRRSVKTNTVGLIMIGRNGRDVRQTGYYMPIMDGILSAIALHRYALTSFIFESWLDVYGSLRSNVDGKCDGMLFIGPPTANEIVPALHERGVPVVLIYGVSTISGVNRIVVDNVAVGKSAVNHLISFGHRRIAYLPGDLTFEPCSSRLQGYKEALAEAKIPFDPELAPNGLFHGPSGYERTKALFNKMERSWPTAIFACNDDMAIWTIKALEELGLNVPGDVSVIGVDNIDTAETCHPPLTTISQHLRETGYKSMQLLHSIIQKEPDVPFEVVVPTTLIVRNSVAAAQQPMH